MKHLKKFLTHLQTFELRLIQRKAAEGPLSHREVSFYEIRHQTHYDEAAVFESELRLLTDMAALDLLLLGHQQLQLVLEQLAEIEERFRAFWVSFHNHALDHGQAYPAGYLHQLGLPSLFIVHNLQPAHAGAAVREELIDDLGESVKLRELMLNRLTRQAVALLSGPKEEDSPAEPSAPPELFQPFPVLWTESPRSSSRSSRATSPPKTSSSSCSF